MGQAWQKGKKKIIGFSLTEPRVCRTNISLRSLSLENIWQRTDILSRTFTSAGMGYSTIRGKPSVFKALLLLPEMVHEQGSICKGKLNGFKPHRGLLFRNQSVPPPGNLLVGFPKEKLPVGHTCLGADVWNPDKEISRNPGCLEGDGYMRSEAGSWIASESSSYVFTARNFTMISITINDGLLKLNFIVIAVIIIIITVNFEVETLEVTCIYLTVTILARYKLSTRGQSWLACKTTGASYQKLSQMG